MRPADCPAPPQTAPAALLDDATAAAALKLALRYARQRWWAEGGTPDLAEYEDAACAALTACLAHYDRAREVPFLQYARPRIWGAVRDTWQSYRAWRGLRTRGPYAQVTPHAHTVRPHVPAVSAPVELAQVLRQQPAVAQQYAVLALHGHSARACETPLGVGGHAHGTALRRQRGSVMGLPSPRGRAASRVLCGEEDNKLTRDTTRSLSGPGASQPLWQQCDGGGVYGRTLCRLRSRI